MNARNDEALHVEIARHLAAKGELSAAEITRGIKRHDVPSVVVNALNAMRANGTVECEQRGKSKGLSYWLAVPLDRIVSEAEAAAVPAEPPKPRVLPLTVRIVSLLPEYGQPGITGREVAALLDADGDRIAGAMTALVRGNRVHRTNAGTMADPYRYTQRAREDVPVIVAGAAAAVEPAPAPGDAPQQGAEDATAQATHAALMDALGDAPAAVAAPDADDLEAVRKSLLEICGPFDCDTEDIPLHGLAQIAVTMHCLEAVRNAQRQDEIDFAANLLAPFVSGGIDTSDMELGKIAETIARQLAENIAAQFPQTKKRGCTPAAYLVRMPGKPPVIRKERRAATDAALSAARRRKRADVYALVPVGTARPGAEWSDAK